MNEEIIGELRGIERKNGLISPHQVVQKARNPQSSMHQYFEWEDADAAESYRLFQARQLIKQVKVKYEGKEISAFHNVQVIVADAPERGYVHLQTLLSNEAMKEQVVQRAAAEIEYWQKKYEDYSELSGIINDDQLKHIVSKGSVKAKEKEMVVEAIEEIEEAE